MGQLRRLHRKIERKEAEKKIWEDEEATIPDGHLALPVGNVVSAPVKGDFLSIPLFAWTGRRVRVNTPLVMVTVLLINSIEDPQPRGTLQVELPIFKTTELATLAALERYGWDGRIWPLDPGWPDADAVEANNLKDLIEQAGLRSTFTFPPSEQGISAQAVKVSRAKGAFLMPPLPDPTSDPDPKKLERLRELYQNPTMLL